jgi:hypothetical protein
MAEAQVDQAGDASREYVAFLLLKMINEAEDNPKRTRKQILDLYSECMITVRNPVQRRATAVERAKEKALEKTK